MVGILFRFVLLLALVANQAPGHVDQEKPHDGRMSSTAMQASSHGMVESAIGFPEERSAHGSTCSEDCNCHDSMTCKPMCLNCACALGSFLCGAIRVLSSPNFERTRVRISVVRLISQLDVSPENPPPIFNLTL